MDIKSISSLTFYVKDLKATTKFYESLGFRPGNQESEHVTFYVNWFSVVFIEDASVKKGEKGEGISINIKVGDANDFCKGVVELGYKPESQPKAVSKSQSEFTLKDPDGYNLVFFDKK
jgi:predicted lactoylglutathione lyase